MPRDDSKPIDLGGDYGPAYPFIKIPDKKSVLICLFDGEPFDTYWQDEDDMSKRTRSPDIALQRGYKQHMTFYAYVLDGKNGDGSKIPQLEGYPGNIAKLDVKGTIRFAMRKAGEIRPMQAIRITRTGSGKKTEYAIERPEIDPETMKAAYEAREMHDDKMGES